MAQLLTGNTLNLSVLPVGAVGAAAYDDSAASVYAFDKNCEIDSIIIDTTGNNATTDVSIYNKTTGELLMSTANLVAATQRAVRKAVTLPDGTAIAGASATFKPRRGDEIRVVVAQANAVAINITIHLTP